MTQGILHREEPFPLALRQSAHKYGLMKRSRQRLPAGSCVALWWLADECSLTRAPAQLIISFTLLDWLPNDNSLAHQSSTSASFFPTPIIAIVCVCVSALKSVILMQPWVAPCYPVHCWLVSVFFFVAPLEKRARLSWHFASMVLELKDGGIISMTSRGGSFSCWVGTSEWRQAMGVRGAFDRKQCCSFHTLLTPNGGYFVFLQFS